MKPGWGMCSTFQSFLVILPNVPCMYYVHKFLFLWFTLAIKCSISVCIKKGWVMLQLDGVGEDPNTYPVSPHLQGGMKSATQISPLLNS